MSALLFMAHPGHELSLLGFIETTRPVLCVLTDGSGGSGTSRLERTRIEMERLGCGIGPVFGAGTDVDVYRSILEGDVARFRALADTLAAWLVAQRPKVAVGDPLEGYNPVHDICRYVLDAACRAARAGGWQGDALTFNLHGGRDAPLATSGVARRIELDEAAHGRKLAIAARYAELAEEVAAARAALGPDAFRTELLYDSTGHAARHAWPDGAPAYEAFGNERVAAGRYTRLITWADHVGPIARALGALDA